LYAQSAYLADISPCSQGIGVHVHLHSSLARCPYELHQLQALVAVAQERSFSRVARLLRIAQPAVSLKKNLEAELHVTLLRRSANGVARLPLSVGCRADTASVFPHRGGGAALERKSKIASV
jgi:hypothetical protein